MTDIRTAAQREAETRRITAAYTFIDGAVWGAARVTPTREQVRQVIVGGADWEHGFRNPYEIVEAMTDAVLALVAGLAEGENDA